MALYGVISLIMIFFWPRGLWSELGKSISKLSSRSYVANTRLIEKAIIWLIIPGQYSLNTDNIRVHFGLSNVRGKILSTSWDRMEFENFPRKPLSVLVWCFPGLLNEWLENDCRREQFKNIKELINLHEIRMSVSAEKFWQATTIYKWIKKCYGSISGIFHRSFRFHWKMMERSSNLWKKSEWIETYRGAYSIEKINHENWTRCWGKH